MQIRVNRRLPFRRTVLISFFGSLIVSCSEESSPPPRHSTSVTHHSVVTSQGRISDPSAVSDEYLGLGDSGKAVDIDGETAIAGIPFRGVGAAAIFTRSGTTWSSQQLITGPGTSCEFGISVGLRGDTAAIGTPCANSGTGPGAVYVYTRSGTAWSQQALLTASDSTGSDRYGSSVDLGDDTLAIGAPSHNGSRGAVYVYARSGTAWSQQGKLSASDGAPSDDFGWSVAISGDSILVGSLLDSLTGTSEGSAYVFTRTGTSWSQQQKLTANDAANDDRFGVSVALDGNTAVVGADRNTVSASAQGAAYVFTRNGTTWSQEQRLTASDAAANDRFGQSVGVYSTTISVGSYWDNDTLTDQGSAYLFRRNGTAWVQYQKLTASDAASDDTLGHSIAMDNGSLMVSAPSVDLTGPIPNAGAAYAFSLVFPPEITSPFSGTQLPGSTTTFMWQANGTPVTEFWIYIGNDWSENDVYDSGSLGLNTSAVVSGLPTDGRNLFIRLYYKEAGTWKWVDYLYYAAGIIPTPSITSPTSGSTFSGTTVTFSWAANGATVCAWWLYIGNTVGGRELHDSGSLSAATLNRAVSSLPSDGRSIYARLWYGCGSIWQYVDVSYTAFGASPLPAITSPAAGATINGTSQLFQWTANSTSVTYWWLYVGTAQGLSDIHDSTFQFGNVGLDETVTTLPANNSSIWVRLWYLPTLPPQTWRYIDYQYTSAP